MNKLLAFGFGERAAAKARAAHVGLNKSNLLLSQLRNTKLRNPPSDRSSLELSQM